MWIDRQRASRPGRPGLSGLVAVAVAGLLVWSSAWHAAIPVAAQGTCTPDQEPNDSEAEAPTLAGPTCIEGTLPADDQDLAYWDLDETALTTRWQVSLDGVPGTATLLQIFATATAPDGRQLADGQPLIELTTPPEGPSSLGADQALLLPGRYLLAIARSDVPGGGQPSAFDYRIDLEPAGPWPASVDVEPNEAPEDAATIDGAFEISGDQQGDGSDVYIWTVDEQARWDLALTVPLERQARLELAEAEGATIDSSSDRSVARFYDLALEPGSYTIRVREDGDEPTPYLLTATPASGSGDPEPNDTSALATALADGQPQRGRLAKDADRDRFRLDVPAGDRVLRDVRMQWRSGANRMLCLLDQDDRPAACRSGDAGLTLPNLALAEGSHTFEVSGTADPEDPYVLRVDVTGPASAAFEAEPNEEVDTATPIDPALGMSARGGDRDEDLFRLHVEGEPQLWQVQLEGTGIQRAELVQARGARIAAAGISGDGTSAVLDDLYLIPGDHWIRVAASGPEYHITTTPLGPPDPDGEREPNDDDARAEGYRIGDRRVGRLRTSDDADRFRFTLDAAQHIRLDIEPPDGAAIALDLEQGGERLASLDDLEPGAPFSYDLWLEAGDHVLVLRAEEPGEDRYTLTSERLDPFVPAIDREPNDGPAWAVEPPPTLSWGGDAVGPRDVDWYTLPRTSGSEPLTIHAGGDVIGMRLTATIDDRPSGQTIRLDRADEGTWVSDDPLPPDAPLFLAVEAGGAYTVELSGAGLQPEAADVEPDVHLEWRLPIDRVAAYWPDEQEVAAELMLRNDGPEPAEVTLETATSHHGWTALAPMDVVSLAPGEQRGVSVPIVVAADASGTEPVLVSARARLPDGGSASATVELLPSTVAPPVDPRPGWPVPDAMLGGLDAAWVGFGAEPAGTLDLEQERRLFDAVTPEGSVALADPVTRNGFSVYVTDHVDRLPIEIDVDLAGDAPIPIVGTIINPQAGEGDIDQSPRGFELLLSSDGQTFEPVLEGSLTTLRIDQAFALDEPVPATHARLRILSKHLDQANYLAIGEWKVIAAPGVPVVDGPLDLADPGLGGHVVSFWPFEDDPEVALAMLDADPDRLAIELSDERRFGLILGFKDARAAQISQLGWDLPDGTDPTERPSRVDVAVSALSPTGPWRSLGTWELDPSDGGVIEPFVPPQPTWARYVRLRGRAPAGAAALELPGSLHVIEREGGPEYRSILGEWGYRSPRGPLEWLDPPDPATLAGATDAGDERGLAAELAEGMLTTDSVEIDADEDWYRIDVPAERNTLEIVVDGRPIVAVALTLYDDTGAEWPMPFSYEPDGRVRYRAEIEPERSYDLLVEQPPFSAVFAFDTSDSIDPFLDKVTQGMRSFLADVRPGREAVSVLPFEEPPLVEGWQDDPFVLQDAFENHVPAGNGSSGAEAALIDASTMLAEREGARAILLVTDGETTTFERTPELWDVLGRVRPIIFSVQIGALLDPFASRQRMEDWAAAGGGHYGYPTTHGEMDRAFERMATWLRRPAVYSLRYETIDVRPARLSVVPAADAEGAGRAATLAPGVGVEIILDTSGSMRKKLKGKQRIAIAKASLRSLISESLAEGVPVALRTFGGPGRGRVANCGTTLTLPLAPLDRASALQTVKKLRARKRTSTPIAAALEAVVDDLASVDGLRSVVLITDGEAGCDGDPAEAIESLVAAGVDVKLDIIGFALQDEAVKEQMATWAAAGGGAYYDAASAGELAGTIVTAVSAPFQVYALDGEPVAAGTVGGEPIELEPGTYRVEILSDPPVGFDEVDVGNGATVTLEFEAP